MNNLVNLEMQLYNSKSSNDKEQHLHVLREDEIRKLMTLKSSSLELELRNIFDLIPEFKPYVLNQIFPKQVEKYVKKKSHKLNKLIPSLKNPSFRQLENALKIMEITNVGQAISYNKLISNFNIIRKELLEEKECLFEHFKRNQPDITADGFNVINFFKLNGLAKKKIKMEPRIKEKNSYSVLQTSYNHNKPTNEDNTFSTTKRENYNHSIQSSFSEFKDDYKRMEDFPKYELNNSKYSDCEEKENENILLDSIVNQEFVPNSFSDLFRY